MSSENSTTTPTAADWDGIDPMDLDANWARDQFLGKSLDDAEELFASNALFYGEALASMPRIPLNFYARALARYLVSERARGDSDGASSFLHTLSWLLEKYPEDLESDTRRLLLQAAEHVGGNQQFYDASVSIYGRFPDRLNRIRRLSRRPSRST